MITGLIGIWRREVSVWSRVLAQGLMQKVNFYPGTQDRVSLGEDGQVKGLRIRAVSEGWLVEFA